MWNKIQTDSPKAVKEFENWFLAQHGTLNWLTFLKLPFMFQSGVILQYLDERGIRIGITSEGANHWPVDINNEWMQDEDGIAVIPPTRPEALEAAIIRGFEIREQQLNNK